MAGMPAATAGRTREAILAHAVDLASAEGLEGLSIGRLAAAIGMSKSGLFGHFGSKEELQLATIREAGERFFEQVVRPALSHEEGLPRLRALIDRYIGYLERRVFPGGCFWGAVSIEFDDRPGPVRDAIQASVRAWLALLEHNAEVGKVSDPPQLAFELYSLGQGANSAYQLFGDRAAFDRARGTMERLLSR
jgi:AcrR family transcriptional regulator